MRAAEEAADAGDAGIVLDEELGAVAGVGLGEFLLAPIGVAVHRPELPASEAAAAPGLADVSIENGPAVIERDEQGDHAERGKGDEQPERTGNDIEGSLGDGVAETPRCGFGNVLCARCRRFDLGDIPKSNLA